jgi:thiol:disulfide interchange protein DsbC
MFQIKKTLLAVLCASIVSLPACADKNTQPAGGEAVIKKNIAKYLLQGNESLVTSVKPAISGLYEVVIGRQIIYTDNQGEHALLDGDLVNLKTKKNITQERMQDITKINFADLPLDKALKKVQGNGSRILVTFEDPNCGYCKKFRTNLDAVKDVTIYTFLFPMFGQDSADKIVGILASDDKNKAFEDWMRAGKVPAMPAGEKLATYQKVTDDLGTLGQKLGVTGTPALFTKDGKRFSGALPTQELNRILSLVKS